jgi:hypothetical protein
MTGLELLLPAILPAAIDAVKNLAGGISRKIGGLSVDDQLKVQAGDIERLKALAALDEVKGSPSQWVVDLRASFRYLAAGVSILGGIYVIVYVPAAVDLGSQLVSAPFSFIFGERLYFGLTGRK